MTAAKQFKNTFSAPSLTKIFVDKIQDSTAIGIDRTTPSSFLENLSSELNLIRAKVISGAYKFTAYKEKLASKGADSLPRVLSIPTVRDRVTLRALAELLAHVFPEAVSEIPQSKIDRISVKLKSGEYAEFVKIDLHKFYPSVSHAHLRKALRTRVRKPEILSLIEKAITTATIPEKKGSAGAKPNTRGVPQGLAISNILAEILLLEFDKKMAAMPGVFYERYIDDVLILCRAGRSVTVLQQVCDDFKKIGLQPHPPGVDGSKTKIGALSDEFDFLGYRCKDLRLSVRRQSVHKFESSLAAICTGYRHRLFQVSSPKDAKNAADVCEWRLNLRITGCIFENRRLGWVFYFSQITDTSALRAVDNTVQHLLQRFSLASKITVKRVLKAFYESQRSNKTDHRYIPNFDSMSISEKRHLLGLLTNRDVSALTDDRVETLFRQRIKDAVRELEKDLAALS
ncbi:reverse transcriptase domain-containing protein [Paraburkholderia sediminicola]|uniref:Reverse transcriptase domain-containing protein n=1 Tax=Paraburkholderia rhynchosiae TaxID=487049 RepID=A0ACC7NNW0_9BURK